MVKDGVYNVKSGYKQAHKCPTRSNQIPSSSNPIQSKTWHLVWNANIPTKIKVFYWKLSHNVVAVKGNLVRRNMGHDPTCLVCKHAEETTIHAFLECSWTRAAWFGSPLQLAPVMEPNCPTPVSGDGFKNFY